MSWLDDSKVGDKWTALKASCDAAGGKLPAVEFAEAALTIITVFDLISGMGVASGDMKGNATTVKTHGSRAGSKASIQDLIETEIAGLDAKGIGKLVGNGMTISCAMLWLIRCAGTARIRICTRARFLAHCRCSGCGAVGCKRPALRETQQSLVLNLLFARACVVRAPRLAGRSSSSR